MNPLNLLRRIPSLRDVQDFLFNVPYRAASSDSPGLPSVNIIEVLREENERLTNALRDRKETLARLAVSIESTVVVFDDIATMATLAADSLREILEEVQEENCRGDK